MTLRVRELRAGYGGRPVLRGVHLDVSAGELVALAGPNGCGKTTLLRAVTRLIPSQTGAIAVSGVAVQELNRRALARLVAVVSQAPSIPDRMRAFDVVLMGRTPHLRLLQAEGAHDVGVVRASMERTDCWHLRARYGDELSGGERQRVLIARALAQEPTLLLLDEPTAHLDLSHQAETFALIRDLCRVHNLAALAVVHDLTLAGSFADRVALMSDGRILRTGPPADVIQADAIAAAFGVRVRVLPDPLTGRPLVVPWSADAAAVALEAAS